MKTRSILLPCAALSTAVTASKDAYLWTVDSGEVKASSNQVSAITSFTAEQILARRKGVTGSAYLHVTDESTLSDLNRFGGWQQPLFGAEPSQQPAKVFISVAGYDGTVSDFNTLPDLWVEDPETTLVETFDARFGTKNVCEYHIKNPGRSDLSIKYTYFEQTSDCLPQSEIEYLPAVMAVRSTVPKANELAGRGISSFHRTLVHLAATENLESTFLVLPTASKLKKPTKVELKKRAEKPLDLPSASAVSSKVDYSFSASNSSSNYTLPRVIPQYFASESSCNNVTNSCMGHGKCVKSHGNQYRCKCAPTIVRTNKDGSTKSVQWGGNACQKKDVSSQFLLFAGFGVFFLTVVAGAIGMMYSMGSADLPSVIGAGVVGPRAQR